MPKKSFEERIAKQKAKLDSKKQNSNLETDSKYVQEINSKMKIAEEAEHAGFPCYLTTDAVVMFKEPERREDIEAWLIKNYGKDENGTIRVPASYGFKKEVKEDV